MPRTAGNRGHGRLDPLVDWFDRVRHRVRPTYVDYVPDEPTTPYRARLTLLPEQNPEGKEIRECEVVRGQLTLFYEVRCPCGKRWFNPRFERIQLCPRCGCAVLLEPPG